MPFDPTDAWQRQIAWCRAAGSPFTAQVLAATLADWHAGGALRDLLPAWDGDATRDALPLRVAAALHALALDGSDAALAAIYPPQDGAWDARVVAAALRRHAAHVAGFLRQPPQTNEIGRSAVLLGGFAAVARATGRPLATLEIGASAGLNGAWHRYRYELGAATWGAPASPVRIASTWSGACPALPARIELASHAACDAAPIDLQAPGAATRLLAYVWADQRERIERLRAAIALAQQGTPQVEAADALPWTRAALAPARAGVATVLFHSVMWQYMPTATRDGLRACIDAAGARATRAAPFAWLAFEPSPADPIVMELGLTLWPHDGVRRVLATAHPHGRWARWA